MLKKIKNNKGFTLIELLAVIVILGILMIIAIPQVTKYIEQSRRDTFADTAKAYINAARYSYLNDELINGSGSSCTIGDTAVIPLKKIEVDNAGKSSFGGGLQGFVTITPTGKDDEGNTQTDASKITHYDYEYKISIQDSKKGWGLNDIKEGEIKGKKVQKLTNNTVSEPGNITCN